MRQKRDKYNVPIGDDMRVYDNMTMNVISGTECTGMTPTPPLDGEEADAYRQLSGVPVEEKRDTSHTDKHSPEQ